LGSKATLIAPAKGGELASAGSDSKVKTLSLDRIVHQPHMVVDISPAELDEVAAEDFVIGEIDTQEQGNCDTQGN
jgi:hypothetical protein